MGFTPAQRAARRAAAGLNFGGLHVANAAEPRRAARRPPGGRIIPDMALPRKDAAEKRVAGWLGKRWLSRLHVSLGDDMKPCSAEILARLYNVLLGGQR